MAYREEYFKVDIREPYMGNTFPLKIAVRVYEPNEIYDHPLVEVIIINPENNRYLAKPISPETFNE